MKLRLGFVSNSSSSSFVAVIEKKAFDKAYKAAHPYIKAVLDALADHIDRKDNFIGTPVVGVSTYEGMGGEGTLDWLNLDYAGDIPPLPKDTDDYEYYKEDCEEGEEPEMNTQAAFDSFLNVIPKDKIVTFSGYN